VHDNPDPRRTPRRAVSAAAASLLLVAAAPVTVAQDDDSAEPRDTSLVCQEPYQSEFDDVGEDNAHYENILCTADHEIARGHTDGTYRPANSVRRDQMAAFITRLIEQASGDELEEGDEDFDDVPEDNTHVTEIRKLANIDVVEGFGDGTYRPAQSVSRDQMASFIARAISYLDNEDARDGSEPPETDEDHFDDVGSDSPHFDAINALAEQAVVVGDGEGTYRPRSDVRRDQMASFLMRGYDYAVQAGLVAPPVPLPNGDDDGDNGDEAEGPTVMGAGTTGSDSIGVFFDTAVEVVDVAGFKVYSDETCETEATAGAEHSGFGPFVNVTLADELEDGDDWFRLDAGAVQDGDEVPNEQSGCFELNGPASDDDDNGDNGDEAEGPSVMGAGAWMSDRLGVFFDTAVEVVEVSGFKVYSDETCETEVAEGVDSNGSGSPLIDVELSAELSDGDDWFRLDAGAVQDGDEVPNEASDCLELQ
jgi:hypothetical protein